MQNIPYSTLKAQLLDGAPDRLVRSFSRRLGYLDTADGTRGTNQRDDDLFSHQCFSRTSPEPGAVVTGKSVDFGWGELRSNGPHARIHVVSPLT